MSANCAMGSQGSISQVAHLRGADVAGEDGKVMLLQVLFMSGMLARTQASRPRPGPRTGGSRPRPGPRPGPSRPRPRPGSRTQRSRPRPGPRTQVLSLRTTKDQGPRPRTTSLHASTSTSTSTRKLYLSTDQAPVSVASTTRLFVRQLVSVAAFQSVCLPIQNNRRTCMSGLW